MIDKECLNQKAGNARRSFRGGAATFRPNAIYLHPTLSFANKASESGKIFDSHQPCSKGNVRGAMACSFAKTRVRQDAERSLRDAGAPQEEISVPPNPEILKSCQKQTQALPGEKFPCLKGIIC
jgi:hypothetical protein